MAVLTKDHLALMGDVLRDDFEQAFREWSVTPEAREKMSEYERIFNKKPAIPPTPPATPPAA